jgi:hypothetical protein
MWRVRQSHNGTVVFQGLSSKRFELGVLKRSGCSKHDCGIVVRARGALGGHVSPHKCSRVLHFSVVENPSQCVRLMIWDAL